MRGKIVMMALLCALLVGLVPPSSARADVEYYVPVEYSREYVVILYNSNWDFKMFVSDEPFYIGSNGCFYSYTDNGILLLGCNNLTEGCWVLEDTINDIYTGYNKVTYRASNHNIYNGNPDDVGELFKAQNIVTDSSYSFPLWCLDAGLNYLPSSSSSDVQGLFEFISSYSYFVMGNDGRYSLVQVYSNDEIEQFTEFVSYDNKLYLHLKDDITGTSIFVKRFDYDVDGWLSCEVNYYTLQYGEMLDLDVSISSDNMLFYSNRTVKTGELFGNVYYEKNTEFTEGFAGEVSPSHNPLVTPTPTPTPAVSGGSGDFMITYKPALSGEVVADSLYMRKEASVNSEAVAAFIKTWSLTLHGYVQNAEGVWYFCSAERDGQVFTGYVLSEYVKIVSGSVGSGDGSTLDETLAQALTELESLALFVARVPMVIGIIFSFMPAWCLGLVGIAFVFLVLGAIKGK